MKLNKYTLLTIALLFGLSACKKDEPIQEEIVPEPKEVIVNEWVTIDKKGIVNVKDMKIESSRRVYIYFSLDSMRIVPAEKAKTSEWDIAFFNFYAANVYANAGYTANVDAPYYQGPGNASLAFVEQNFDDVTTAPADDQFDATGRLPLHIKGNEAELPAHWAHWVINEKGASTHIIPYANKTLVVRLTDGRYAKLQYQSNYKGSLLNATPEDHTDDKLGYVTFRYFISKKGSKDLTTGK